MQYIELQHTISHQQLNFLQAVSCYKYYETKQRNLQHYTEGSHIQNKMGCYWFHFLCPRNPGKKQTNKQKQRNKDKNKDT